MFADVQPPSETNMSKVLLRLLRYRHLKERHVVENWRSCNA